MTNRGRTAAAAAREWKATLPRERRKVSNLRGGLLFGISLVAYSALFFCMFAAPKIGQVVVSTLLSALAIGAMFVAGHDAAHRTLVRTPWLNRFLGRIAMLPAWHPFTPWIHVHNTLHHGWTSLKGKHPDFCPMSKDEYDALPAWRRAVERFYRSAPGIGASYVFGFYGKCLLWPKGEHCSPYPLASRLDRLLVAAFVVVQITVGAMISEWSGRWFATGWLWSVVLVTASWATWAYFMGVASYQQHTHPRTAWYDDVDEWNFYHVQLRSSTHVKMPEFVDRLLHNIMDHPAHHLDPTIPMYELPESQRALEEAAGEHAVVVPWTIQEFLRTCKLCKLYDYRNHCWTDFDGRPTTPTGLNGGPAKEKVEKRELVGAAG